MKTLSAWLSLCLLACSPEEHTPWPEQREAPIVAGTSSGRESVVALVSAWELGALRVRTSPFCSGVLVAPHWVLTAAHCVSDGGLERRLHVVSAADLRAAELEWPPDLWPAGDGLHRVVRIVLAPLSTGTPGDRDLALIELATPMAASPLPWFSGDVNALVDQEVVVVGYGHTGTRVELVDEGARLVSTDDKGLRRESRMKVGSRVGQDRLRLVHTDGGFCFADSGGPALIETAQGDTVLSLSSSVVGCLEDGCEYCATDALTVRVDAHADFIDELTATRSSCLDCECAGTCQATCADTWSILRECQGGTDLCELDTLASTLASQRGAATALLRCGDLACSALRRDTPFYVECLAQSCRAEANACLGALLETCADLAGCVSDCDNEPCQQACRARGTLAASLDFAAYEECLGQRCPDPTDVSCPERECGGLLAACRSGGEVEAEVADAESDTGVGTDTVETEGDGAEVQDTAGSAEEEPVSTVGRDDAGCGQGVAWWGWILSIVAAVRRRACLSARDP